MGRLLSFPEASADVVTQDELTELRRAMHMKVVADAYFMGLNLSILARVQGGARIQAGDEYHPNLGMAAEG